jgi:3-isopropylmalate/(R)-2-methylmalate dehydratase large subunit
MANGMTVCEKLLSRAANQSARAGSYVNVAPARIAVHDGNRPTVPDVLRELGFDAPIAPERVAVVLDHGVPTPNAAYANVQGRLRAFACAHGIRLFEQGDGISHLVVAEAGLVRPGDVVIASDSHTTTLGALHCLATGVGATDAAVALARGSIWFRVPRSVRVELTNELRPGVTARDVALTLLQAYGTSFARYRAIEFAGDGVASLGMAARFTLTNLAIELGAKFGIMPFDAVLTDWLRSVGVENVSGEVADADAVYERSVALDLSAVEPMVAMPHNPSNVERVEDVSETRIDLGFIGTCTNGRIEDLRSAATVLEGRQLAPGRRLIVVPGSRATYLAALREGLIEIFTAAGAMVSASGCGPCAGVQGGIAGDSENVIATAPRNFRGRMGNPNAGVHLASPATVAASVVAGRIVHADELGDRP